MQGFIWEREWRHTDPNGFQFSHGDIEIICCPEEERDEIADILKAHVNHIVFVSSWEQYDDVKEFLKIRSIGWTEKIPENSEKNELVVQLNTFKKEKNKINSYKEYASGYAD